ncbi:MAG: ATP-binding protein, partial [Verrucomicrobiota bacterium]
EKLPRIAERPGFCWMERNLIENGGSRKKVYWTIRPTQSEGTEPCFTLTFCSKKEKPPKKAQPSLTLRPVKESDGGNRLSRSEPSPSIEPEQRHESLAMAAGGVAHDFKNALQTIKSNLEMAQSISGSQSQVSTFLSDANAALDDAEVLAQQMLAFTRDDATGSIAFDVSELVTRVSRLCTAGSRVKCHLTLEPQLRPVEGDPNRLYQVLHNLVINACQAMPNGGVLHLTAANANVKSKNPYSVGKGRYTVISVRDRGCGIPPEVLPRIFDKNYSTKPGGSGFGLASCRAIIEGYGGAIRAASRVGVGTEFLVFFPSSQNKPNQGAARVSQTGQHHSHQRSTSTQESPLPATPCRVLVVEDQPGVLKASQSILSHLGHETIAALDGEEALTRYRRHLDSAEPIDVVLLDMTLPGGLSGREVFRELKKIDPEANVIATSGYFDDSPGRLVDETGFSAVLAKPFSMKDLSGAIQDALIPR